MKALVIGGNGFIGSHLVDELIRRSWHVAVLDLQERRFDQMPARCHFIKGDLTQAYLVREALSGVDIVYHLAWTSVHEVANQDPVADIKDNLIPSVQLLELCRLAQVRRVIFMSSGGTVYGRVQEVPIAETHPGNPINAYGITKLAVEKYLQMFYHLYGLDYAILRPSVPYGPRQNPLGRQGAVPIFLYRTALGLPITIWGDGSVSRDYFYISDLVSALLAAADQRLNGQRIFNLGGSKDISLSSLLGAVEKTVGRKAKVNYLARRRFDAARVILDTSLAYNVLKWQPRVAFDDGLARTWAWIASTFEIDDKTQYPSTDS